MIERYWMKDIQIRTYENVLHLELLNIETGDKYCTFFLQMPDLKGAQH